jgi:hypothetical protein
MPKNLGTSIKSGMSKMNHATAGSKLALGSMGADLITGALFRTALGGENLGSAILHEIPESAMFAIAPGLMWTYTAAQLAPLAVQGYMAADQGLRSRYNQARKPGTNFTYTDTRQAYTMRQAAVQAIQGSKMNARNALGGEASLMHRGYGDRRA